jgi:hypothetical protein
MLKYALHKINIAEVFIYILASFKFGVWGSEDGTDVQKHVEVVEDHAF